MRRLLVLAMGALLIAPAPSRAAGLGADVLVTAEGHFNIYGSDRASYLVDLVAKTSEAGTRTGAGSLTVTIRRCLGAGCKSRYTYAGALPQGAFTVAQDLSSGYLATSVFGRPVLLTWDSPQGPTLPSYEASGSGPQVGVRLYQVTRSGGLLFSKPCQSKNGLLTRSAHVDADAAVTRAMPRSMPRALTGMARGVCSKPVA